MSERIQEIRERLAKAKAGPWKRDNDTGEDSICIVAPDGACVADILEPFNDGAGEDADLIANAPSDLTFLLEQLDAAQKDVKRLQFVIDNDVELYCIGRDDTDVWVCSEKWSDEAHEATAPREAIDAAMQAAEQSHV